METKVDNVLLLPKEGKLEMKVDDVLLPLFSRILVERKEVEKVGSIFVPSNSQEMKATEGVVIAVGDECDVIKAGDTIYWGRYSGAEIEREKKKYVIMNEADVLCLVQENGAKPAEKKKEKS